MASPHDALFKAVFSDPANAAGELASVIPRALAATLDWRTLTLEPGSFVDEELKDRHADLLYSATRKRGGDALVYLLFEHQSSPDAWMAFRLLVYMVRIWEAYRKADAERATLPPIVPVVLYQGERGWRPRRLVDSFVLADDELAAYLPHVPDFAFVLDDLRAISDERLRERAVTSHAKVTLALMREAQGTAELAGVLRQWMGELRELMLQPTGAAALRQLLRYIAELRDGEVDALREVIGRLGSRAEDVMMTMAERWKQEGEARGEARGEAKGKAEAILAVLAARGIDVSEDWRGQVLACPDVATLNRWLERAVTAASTAEICT
jgi:predicted transposase/invertase (TIGR01784 family)